MKKTGILMRLYGVTPTIVLRRNLFKARHVTQKDYSLTTCKVYTVTLLIWKDELSESALQPQVIKCNDKRKFRSLAKHTNLLDRFSLSSEVSIDPSRDLVLKFDSYAPHGENRSWSNGTNSSSSTVIVDAGVVVGEATGDGTVRDASEICKDSDDHSGILSVGVSSTTCWSGTDLELYLSSKVLGAIYSANSRTWRLAALYPTPRGSFTAASLTGSAYCCFSDAASSLSELGTSSYDSSLPEPADGAGEADEEGSRDNGVVESDGAVECDEVILVSNGSEASNSSSMRDESGVGSSEVGVWTNDGGVVLAASG
nr:hypothetical protein [Tanacetum cinerariifolium]GEX90461.1 hypothetical protein [Tanacetum cinerariifolium]